MRPLHVDSLEGQGHALLALPTINPCSTECVLAFAVSDIVTLIDKARAAGVRLRNDPMVFHDRKLAFLAGPEGVIVELAEWK